MNSLSEIKSRYLKAIEAKPKGQKFVYGDTIIRKDDSLWNIFTNKYIPMPKEYIGDKASAYVPIIRQIKTAPKPKITPLPESLKTSLPKGYVYLGKGGEFKVPNGKKEYDCEFSYSSYTSYDGRPLKWGDNWTRNMVSCNSCYYIFPINSEIAKLNGVKPNTNSLLEENAALKKELALLKDKIAAFIGGVK